VAPARGGATRRSAESGFEGVPTGILGDLLTKAKNDIKGAQSRADMIRRELKRRKKHATR
jgi:hypothetical protein